MKATDILIPSINKAGNTHIAKEEASINAQPEKLAKTGPDVRPAHYIYTLDIPDYDSISYS